MARKYRMVVRSAADSRTVFISSWMTLEKYGEVMLKYEAGEGMSFQQTPPDGMIKESHVDISQKVMDQFMTVHTLVREFEDGEKPDDNPGG